MSSSDCHFLEDLDTGFTLLDVGEQTFAELAKALSRREGRERAIA